MVSQIPVLHARKEWLRVVGCDETSFPIEILYLRFSFPPEFVSSRRAFSTFQQYT